MKKIFGLLIGTLFAILLCSGSTWAYFDYAEASIGDSPVEGTLDLEVTGTDSVGYTFQLSNVAPGDSGSGGSKLANTGNVAGKLDVSISVVTNTPGTGGEFADDGSGDLGAKAEIAIYIDVDMSGDWSNGDVGLKSDGTTYSQPTALKYDVIDHYGGVSWNAVAPMVDSAKYDFTIMWRVPTTVGNEIQGDSVSFDITFTLSPIATQRGYSEY